MNSPVAFIIFNRPKTTKKVFEKIKKAQPPRLYLIADGPREDFPDDILKIESTRRQVESIDWECEVTKIYSENNLGCGYRLPTGLDAVFEKGAFRPVDPGVVHVPEGQRVRLLVEEASTPNCVLEPDILQLAGQVYAGLSAEQIDEIERIATDRSSFFRPD